MFITGPDVIKTVTGEDITMEELGGALAHNSKSGVAHYMGADEADAIDYVNALLSYLPSNNMEEPPAFEEVADLEITGLARELDTFIPDGGTPTYEMPDILHHNA